MCKCDPRIRTPWCGKPGCEMPKQKPLKREKFIVEAWFKTTEEFDNEADARRAAEQKKEHKMYRDIQIVELKETNITHL